MFFLPRFLYFIPGYLYQQFVRHEDYQDVFKYAQDLGCLLWSSEKKRMLSVTALGHENVRQYVKRKIAASSSMSAVS